VNEGEILTGGTLAFIPISKPPSPWTNPIANNRKRAEHRSPAETGPGALEEVYPSSHTPSLKAVSFQKCSASAAARGMLISLVWELNLLGGPSLAQSFKSLLTISFLLQRLHQKA
jgi:hypothetical protein